MKNTIQKLQQRFKRKPGGSINGQRWINMIPSSEITPALKINIKSFLANSKKILIIEDDIKRIQWFQKTISPFHNTTICTNGEAAFKLLKTDSNWDLIFLDHDLHPEHLTAVKKIKTQKDYLSWQRNYTGSVTGFDIAIYLKNQSWIKETPVLIHSMNAQGSAAIKLVLGQAVQTPFELFSEMF